MTGRGDEARVLVAFEAFLIAEGWTVVRDAGGWADVVAVRGGERLVAEAKGDTGTSSGLDVDTMFGQLLRRMGDRAVTNWAVVVPTRVVPKVLRVPDEVRNRLGIEIFEVTVGGLVRRLR
ncbi:MAG: hypothetical protein HY263_07485 [Chloroflexi bacterium]|nr:hypothetical protein [Chloroflexota bacterium]